MSHQLNYKENIVKQVENQRKKKVKAHNLGI